MKYGCFGTVILFILPSFTTVIVNKHTMNWLYSHAIGVYCD